MNFKILEAILKIFCLKIARSFGFSKCLFYKQLPKWPYIKVLAGLYFVRTSLILYLFLLPFSLFPQEYFRSNSIGLPLEMINPIRKSDFPYVLSVKDQGNEEIRILYFQGLEEERWVFRKNNNRVLEENQYSKDQLIKKVYYSQGYPVREENYSDGNLELSLEYKYQDGILQGIHYRGEDNTSLYEDTFLRNNDGRLREVKRSFPEGKRITTSFRYSANNLIEQWYGYGDGGILFRYRNSLLIREETWKGSVLTQVTDYSYEEGNLVTTKMVKPGTKEEWERSFDSQGRIIKETGVNSKGERELIEYLYTEDRLARKTRQTSGNLELWVFSYDQEGWESLEEYWVNGRLLKKVYYNKPGYFVEEIFLRGKAFLKVYWEEGVRVREVSTGEEEEKGL